MDSATSKQLAQAASQSQKMTNTKAALHSREIDNLDPEHDSTKINTLKGKILSLQNQSVQYAIEASEHRSDAMQAEIKETDAKFKEIEKEQEKVRKEEAKQAQEAEDKLAENELKDKKVDSKQASKNKNSFGDDLLFLNEDRDFVANKAEDVIDFTVAKPAVEDTQGKVDGAKRNDEDELVKTINAAATGS